LGGDRHSHNNSFSPVPAVVPAHNSQKPRDYIILTALLVPAIVKLGVVVPAAHMFAFYFAILSAPPVALAVFAACGIAKSDLWSTGWAAVKIGDAGFIVPLRFVYEPSLLMIGSWQTIVSSCITAVNRRHPVRRRSQRLSSRRRQLLATRAADRRRLAADRARY
jgi:TRAP-type uncharacterized transport system fused permease subunit